MTSAKKPSAFEKHAFDEDLSYEERLQAIRTWSAALAAVEEQMPEPAIVPNSGDMKTSRGWNNCLSTMSERIAALRSEET